MKKIPLILPILLVSAFGMDIGFAQAPPQTLTLTAKLRDVVEFNNTCQPAGNCPATPNPDFNNYGSCPDKGYVANDLVTTGTVDTAVFKNDNRNPVLIKTNRTSDNKKCFTSIPAFDIWFNDMPGQNRSFLKDLTFNRLANGMYEFKDDTFFPLDKGQNYRKLNPLEDIYGHLNTGIDGGVDVSTHNYGFTMEFHANFTYLKGTNQIFNFTGDDDVWAFINGKLAMDLGGLHVAESGSFNLDDLATSLGLVNNESYLLEFFYAERHQTASHCTITTSLVLGTQKVATPVATPGTSSFTSQVSVSLADATPDAIIYYTLDGSTPDSTKLRYNPASPIAIIGTTTLKAIAYKAGWIKSDVASETYTKTFVASTMQILDQNGNPLTGGYLSELNSAYTVKVTTTQAGLAQITPIAATQSAKDQETLTLSTVVNVGDAFVFSGVPAFAVVASATANNKTTEASTYDTLTVTWTNPKDANDVAVAKVPVRPAPKQAKAYFSKSPVGADFTDQYAGTESVIYFVVEDQILPAGAKPTVTLTTKSGIGRAPDNETFDLVAVAPGKYVAAIPVDNTKAGVPNDKKLQLTLDDIITGTYQDPIDTEAPAVANAGYGIAPVIDASLQFTDAAGNILAGGVYYSPDAGFLYLTYSDDYVGGDILTKTVTLTITNDHGAAPSDTETFALNLVPAKTQGSKGVWEGKIPLKDLVNIAPRNNTAETYILGEVTATVTSHNKTKGPDVPVSDQLLVAYANQEAVITLTNQTGGTDIDRTTPGLIVKINDQSLSSGTDTLTATLSCMQSGDVLSQVKLIEVSPGVYQSVVIPKNEGATGNAGDGTLTCKDKDIIKVTYTDPVYGTPKEVTVLIDAPISTRLSYAPSATDTSAISSVAEGEADAFYAVLIARSPTVDKIDSFQVTLTSPQGEKETFWAVETGVYSQKFMVKVPFGFVTGNVTAGNGKAEGKITATDLNNRVVLTGSVTVDGLTTKADITLVAAYVPVVKAYIKDSNGDGTGDKVYVQFEKKLPRLPATLDAQWNTTAGAFVSVTGAKLSFLDPESTIVVADFGAGFPAGLTSIPTGEAPKAKLPPDPLFGSQSPLIEDSIGPILMAAEKHPSNVNSLQPGDPSFNLDTLIITLSEPIKAAVDFKQVLKFSTSCNDYANAKTITAYNNPTADPTNPNRYVIIVDNSGSAVPLTGNCLFINGDGNYTDVPGNLPPNTGLKLTGSDRDRIIQLFRGFPPVAGLDANRPGFQVAVQDTRDPSKGGYSEKSATGYDVNWIPPYGFDEAAARNGTADHGPIPANVTDGSSGETETTVAGPLPQFLSTVQVVTTAPYVADVNIFDNLGNFVVSFKQAFGYHGETGNVKRVVPKGLVSYLWWDTRDHRGQMAGQGVYVWKVVFRFQNGKQEIQYTRTGLMRSRK